MMKVKSFGRKGIKTCGYKSLANKNPIQKLIYKGNYLVPMSQHLGVPAKCLVEVGDFVCEYQMIGEALGFISANVHSPVAGEVVAIKEIVLANGVKCQAVEIVPSEDFLANLEKDKSVKDFDLENTSTAILLEEIKNAGIVGMGGATFPSNVKLSIPKGKVCKHLIINGVECEPFLCADHRLMLEKTSQILEGIKIVRKILNPEQVTIGIENNKKDAIAKFSQEIKENNHNIAVCPLKVKYPQGDEKQLIKAIMGVEMPSGTLPIDVGTVVLNIGTIYAIYELFYKNKSLVERVVTVSGDAIENPSNFLVRIGVPYSFLIEQAGGFSKPVEKIISGGPMMGFAVYDTSLPVTKGSGGILALSKKIVRDKPETNCLNCGKCVAVCPMGLFPSMLYKLIDNSKFPMAMKTGLMDCKECGCCAYACPAGIPLVQGFKLGKRMGAKK